MAMRRAVTVLALGLAGAVAGTTAQAAEPEARGFYLGANVGSATLDDDGIFSGLQFDDSDVSYGVLGGYKFLKYLAMEVRLTNLGGYAVETDTIDATAVSVHVLGIVPFGTSGWEIFGQLGLGSLKLDAGFDDETNTVGSAGLGVRFYPTKNIGLSLQTDAYAYEETDLGPTYNIGVVTTQLGFQYLF